MLLKLFLTFLKVGAVSFGGGYGMISMIREDCLANGWLTEEELLNFIAVAESTPGPIAVNMATFVGSSQAGALGTILATLGVVLPSFIIILLVASVMTRLLKYAAVKATLGGIRPAIVGMILATAVTLLLSAALSATAIGSAVSFDWKSLCILGIIYAVYFALSKTKGKPPSPIALILLSGIMGIIIY